MQCVARTSEHTFFRWAVNLYLRIMTMEVTLAQDPEFSNVTCFLSNQFFTVAEIDTASFFTACPLILYNH